MACRTRWNGDALATRVIALSKLGDAWLSEVSQIQIPELQGFALGIERDKKAVFAGLTLPHSNGIVEGKVNNLKLIKRMGFGRAEFPLLR